MTRVCIICEGPTEVEFVNGCLWPYLKDSGVDAYGTVLSAKSGHHRGGRVSVERLARSIARHYSKANRVSTLVDFYGFQDRGGRTRAQLEADIAKAAQNIIGDYDPRYVLPYVQMHEFEGLLFTNPAAFEKVDGWNEEVKAALMDVAQKFSNPEDINDGPATAPSKRIQNIFPEGTYSKIVHGPLIAKATGIDAMRAKCRAFNEWVGKLQAWGGAG